MGVPQQISYRNVTWSQNEEFLSLSCDQSRLIAWGNQAPDKHHTSVLAVFKLHLGKEGAYRGRCLPVKRKAGVKCYFWALSFNVLFNINITSISRNENRQQRSSFPYYRVMLPCRYNSLPLAQHMHYYNLGWVAGGIPFLEERQVLD